MRKFFISLTIVVSLFLIVATLFVSNYYMKKGLDSSEVKTNTGYVMVCLLAVGVLLYYVFEKIFVKIINKKSKEDK